MKNYMGQYKVLIDVKTISKLMLKCDLAITNSGLSKYELSALGVPSLLISNSNKHSIYSDEFSSYGSSRHLGCFSDVSNFDIREKCKDLMLDYKLRLQMSKKGKKFLDNNGLDRLWEVISNYSEDDRYAKNRVE